MTHVCPTRRSSELRGGVELDQRRPQPVPVLVPRVVRDDGLQGRDHDVLADLVAQGIAGGLALGGIRLLPAPVELDDRRGVDVAGRGEIGRASCRENVCTYVLILVVAVNLEKKKEKQYH